MKRLISLVFFFLIFFSNLTQWQLPGNSTGFDIFLVLFIVFVIYSFCDFRKFYGIELNYKIFIPLLLFFLWWSLRSLLSVNSLRIYNDEVWQWVLMFVLFTNFISHNLRVGYLALLAIVFSATVLLVKYYADGDVVYLNDRLCIFPGANPNAIGSIASKALIIVFLILKYDVLDLGKIRYLLLLIVPGLFEMIIQTGSRGALIYLGFGILSFLLFGQIKLKWIVFGLLALVIIGDHISNYFLSSEIFQNRWISDDLSRLGGRDFLWKNSYELFLNRPLLGYGDGGIWKILRQDPHNLYLMVLVSSGIIGLGFFTLFLIRIFQLTIRNIQYKNSLICFVLLIISFVAFAKEGGAINSLTTWINLAIIAGLSTAINNNYHIDSVIGENEIIDNK